MNPKRILISTVLLASILFTVSCVYLRLYKVQSQLNDFENNFELTDKGGLGLIFLNPVLESSDMVWLMKNAPLKKEKKGDGEVWTYVFEKQYMGANDEGHEYDIPLVIIMQNDMLKEVIFPERFLKDVSIPLIKRMFSSMGEADVNKLSKSANSTFRGMNPDEIPKIKNIVDTLGKPYSVEESGDTSTYTYLYYLKHSATDPNPKVMEFEAVFVFKKEDGSLMKTTNTIRGMTVSFDFTSN
jgi:outer membrane protein assembly factor BamE (lipoprotein component of BamABCDE complex)